MDIITLAAISLLAGPGQEENVRIYHTDFSRLSPGAFGEFAARGFPEYHHVPRKFTDGWSIVNNRGPEEWKVLEIDGRNTLNFLGYNADHWTKDYIYPILCAGDPLWTDYSVKVRMTPLSRPEVQDLQGVIFRYQEGRHYYFFGPAPGGSVVLRYRDGEKGFRKDGWRELGSSPLAPEPGRPCTLRVDAFGSEILCSIDGKRIQTPGFGVSRALRIGDLDGDGRPDFLLAQSIPYFRSNYHHVSCLTAIDMDGRLLWQKGKPDPDHAYVSYDVAVQIHDWDGDGACEVIYAEDRKIRILDGKTGALKRQFEVPPSRILPEETSWKEYKHYYRRDHLPFLNVDCFSFADLRGTGRPADMIIKDRHTRLWAFDDRFQTLWTATANLGHFPWFADFGKDEVFLGYTIFDHDGKAIWTLDGKLEEHSDGTCGGDFSLEGKPPLVFIAGSDDGVIAASAEGKIVRHHRIGHAQTPTVGQYRPDVPGLEFCTITFWGEPGLVLLLSGVTGEEIARFEPIHAGSPILPVNWRGDGQEFILLSTNPQEGGMLDGHPDLACMAHDLTGDARDEIITWSPDAIWIYTQSEPFRGGRIHAPRRTPTYNESNYTPNRLMAAVAADPRPMRRPPHAKKFITAA